MDETPGVREGSRPNSAHDRARSASRNWQTCKGFGGADFGGAQGQAEANPQAQRGYSRDHRPDCAQVLIALVVTFDGFPLGYEVFAGATHHSRTLQAIVTAMEARHGALGRVWIADRGMASAENLAWLRDTGRRYIIGAPKSELKKFASELADRDGWRTVKDGGATL